MEKTIAASPAALGWVVVCEASARWSTALGRELADQPIRSVQTRVVQTRSPAECLETLEELSEAVVVVELSTREVDRGLRLVADLDRDHPRSSVIVTVDRAAAGYGWLARELGAIHVVDSPRRLAPVMAIIERQVARLRPESQDIFERVRAAMPWRPVPDDAAREH